jgi:hypothetical protein
VVNIERILYIIELYIGGDCDLYCIKCGRKNIDNAKFCQICGQSLIPDEREVNQYFVNHGEEYKSTVNLTKSVIRLNWINIPMNIIILVFLLLLDCNIIPLNNSDNSEMTSLCFVLSFFIAYTIVLLVKNIQYYILIYRIKRNTIILGTKGVTYSPGWTVGYYFVPFINFYKVYYVMSELWNSNDPECNDGISWQSLKKSSFVHLWYSFWIIPFIIDSINRIINFENKSGTNNLLNMTENILTIITIVLCIISCYITIIFIRKLQERQLELASAIMNYQKQKRIDNVTIIEQTGSMNQENSITHVDDGAIKFENIIIANTDGNIAITTMSSIKTILSVIIFYLTMFLTLDIIWDYYIYFQHLSTYIIYKSIMIAIIMLILIVIYALLIEPLESYIILDKHTKELYYILINKFYNYKKKLGNISEISCITIDCRLMHFLGHPEYSIALVDRKGNLIRISLWNKYLDILNKELISLANLMNIPYVLGRSNQSISIKDLPNIYFKNTQISNYFVLFGVSIGIGLIFPIMTIIFMSNEHKNTIYDTLRFIFLIFIPGLYFLFYPTYLVTERSFKEKLYKKAQVLKRS